MTVKSRAAFISISVAGVLAVIKLITGLAVNSLVIISSAVDSIMDIASSSVNYYAIKTSEQPPDKEHPFGHHKYESLATFIQSIIIMLTGTYIIYESYEKFTKNEVITDINSGLYIMVFSIIATSLLTLYLKKTAKKEESTVLEADALHYQIDILTNMAIIITLVVIKFTELHIIDPILSVLIAIYIFYSAVKLNFQVSRELLDSKIPEETKKKIITILNEYDDYHQDFHKLRTRQAGNQKFIDLHLTLCKEISLEEAHKIADKIEKHIEDEVKNTDITIHIEPCVDDDCPGTDKCVKKLKIDLD